MASLAPDGAGKRTINVADVRDRDYVLANSSAKPSQFAGSAVPIGVQERSEVCAPYPAIGEALGRWGPAGYDLGVGNL